MSRSQPARVVRGVLIACVYSILWLACDALSAKYSGHSGASPWYLGASLSFYLVYTFGEIYIPVLLLVALLRGAVFGTHAPMSYPIDAAFGVVQATIYGLTAWLLRRRLHVRIPFCDLRDVVLYVLLACFAACVLAALGGIGIFVAIGRLSAHDLIAPIVTYATGDAVGFLTLVPALALFVTPHLVPELATAREPREREIGMAETAVLITLLAGCAVLGYRLFELGSEAPVYYFLFLPLVWMAVRGGLTFAVIGITCADLTVVAFDAWFRIPVAQSFAYQSYIITSSLTALALGAMVTQRWREQREELERARLDHVTGLPSPQALDEWFELAQLHQRVPMTLLLVAVDNMRWVNEGLPRTGIDLFLRCVAERLNAVHMRQLFLAHVNEAEFAVVLKGSDAAVATLTAEKIRHAFEEPFDVSDAQIYATVSVGVVIRATGEGDLRTMVSNAEQALDEARQRGIESVAFHTGKTREPLISLAAQLHDALREGEFELFYQPIFDFFGSPSESDPLASASVVGVEALLRWNHPRRGLLTPDAFIDLLESMRLGERVGSHVVERACDRLALWHRAGFRLMMCINAFGRQVLNPDFGGALRATIMQHGLDPQFVVIELLERLISGEKDEIVTAVGRIRQSGVRIAIDDFGTGHSSLARLREVSFDILKIDRSFIGGIEIDVRSEDVVTALSGLARDFGVSALAEGVETYAQLRFLLEHRYRYIQGYYLALPMPAAEFDSFLHRVNVPVQ